MSTDSLFKTLDVRMNKNVYNNLVEVADEWGLSGPETAYYMIKWYIENKPEGIGCHITRIMENKDEEERKKENTNE